MNTPKTHLFVCTNAPNKEGRCGHKNAESLRQDLKKRCGDQWGRDVRVNAAGCLGHCERGIVAVVYPEADWHFDLKDTDHEILFQAVKAAVEKHK